MKDRLKKEMIKSPYLYITLKKKNPKKIFNTINGYKSLKNHPSFDENFYIKNTENLGLFKSNPLLHYILFGYKKNYNPSSKFDTKYYLKKYKNVKKADINPLSHYILHGKNEGKYPNFQEENIELNKQIAKSNYITNQELTTHHIESKKDYFPEYKKIGVFIDFFVENPLPSYYIRIFYILNKIAKNKKYKFFIYPIKDKFKKDFFNRKCFDAVILQRRVRRKSLKIILNRCKRYDIKVIYELDDDLLSLPKTHPGYKFMVKRYDLLKLMAEESDMLVVSTDELKREYLKYNKNIEVVKNYLVPPLLNSDGKLDYERKQNKKTNKQKNKKLVKIGYFGTRTHKEDFSLIKESIKNVVNKVKEKGIDLQLDILGVYKTDEIKESWINISTDFKPYITFLKDLKKFDWDIGIAPLVDDGFNSRKSELKYLEYTSLKIPSVYSDVKPYNLAIQDGFNGLLAKPPKEWEEKLEKLILDESLRDKIVQNAVNDMNENYLIDSRVQKWEEILEKYI
jgi:glycosyltransferase involved in cell wall biosynthesis